MYCSKAVTEILAAYLAGIAILLGSSLLTYKFYWKGCLVLAPLPFFMAFFFGLESDIFSTILSFALMGAVGGITLRLRKTLQFFLLISTLVLTGLFTANYYFLKHVRNIDQLVLTRSSYMEKIDSLSLPEKNKKELKEQLELSFKGDIVRDQIAFSFFLNYLIFSAFFFLLVKWFIGRYQSGGYEPPKGLESFRLHDYFIYTIIIGWAVVLLVDKKSYGPVYTAGLNLALVFTTLYFVQALGILKFFLLKWKVPVFILPVSLLMLITAGKPLFLFVAVTLSGVGAIDFWADFRKLAAPPAA